MRYTVTMQLDKAQYEYLRKRYGKRVTVKPSTLVEMAVAEAVKAQALTELNETGYAPVESPKDSFDCGA